MKSTTFALVGVCGASELKTDVRPCRATCRGASSLCDTHLRQRSARPAWGAVAVAEVRSCATALQLLVQSGLHRLPFACSPNPSYSGVQMAGLTMPMASTPPPLIVQR